MVVEPRVKGTVCVVVSKMVSTVEVGSMAAAAELARSELARLVDLRTFRLETRIRLAYSGFHRLRLPARRVSTTSRDLLTLLGLSTGVSRKEVSMEAERRFVEGMYETVGREEESKELEALGERRSSVEVDSGPATGEDWSRVELLRTR